MRSRCLCFVWRRSSVHYQGNKDENAELKNALRDSLKWPVMKSRVRTRLRLAVSQPASFFSSVWVDLSLVFLYPAIYFLPLCNHLLSPKTYFQDCYSMELENHPLLTALFQVSAEGEPLERNGCPLMS